MNKKAATPTTTLDTPNNHKVEIKTVLTGREARELQRPFYKMADVNIENPENPLQWRQMDEDTIGEVMKSSEDLLISMMVVSVDGESENVLDAVLDLPAPDYNAVVAKLNELHRGREEAKKK